MNMVQTIARTKTRRVHSSEAFFLAPGNKDSSADVDVQAGRLQAHGILQRILKSVHSLVEFLLSRSSNAHKLNKHKQTVHHDYITETSSTPPRRALHRADNAT